MALNNFFKTENILQLRELALKEVALRVEKKVENEVVVSSVGVRRRSFWHASAVRRRRLDASFVRRHVWQPVTILLL